MTVLTSESYNGQSLGSSNSTLNISITNTCYDSPNLIGVLEDQQSNNRKHIIQWQYGKGARCRIWLKHTKYWLGYEQNVHTGR